MTKVELSKATEIEYNALKAEQRQRIKTRDNMLYLQIASIVGLSTIYESFSIQVVATILPFVSFVFGWKYYINDQKVSEIAQYFKLYAEREGVFEFEKIVRESKWRKARKFVEFALRTVVFILPIFACAVYFGFLREVATFELFLSISQAISAVALFLFFLSEMDA